MKNNSLKELASFIREKNSFVLASHINPDGDAIGSILALGLVLENLGKKVSILTEDKPLESFSFLADYQKVFQVEKNKKLNAEVFIALDTATHQRLGRAILEASSDIPFLLNIDHHPTNSRYGDMNFIDDSASATAEIVYQLCRENDFPLNDAVRKAIYLGISTDTGSFRYSNTRAKTHQIIAELLESGLDIAEINQQIQGYPYRKLLLLSELLQSVVVEAEGRVISWCLSEEVKERVGFQKGDSEDMVNHIRDVNEVFVALSFEELGDDVRISLRSNIDDVDVSQIASRFGGGGHSRAAGIQMRGTLQDVHKKVINEVISVIEA